MRTTVTLQAEGTVRFEGDRYKCLMIRKRVRDTVRKTDEQGVKEQSSADRENTVRNRVRYV